MGSLPFRLFPGAVLPWLAIILLLVLLLLHFRRQRVDREKKNAELRWFSELHLFGKALAESPDPKQMADLTLQRTTEMFGSADSYILVQTTGSDAISHVCAQGLSARTVERLSSEPLRSYLASCGERWGNLLVFPRPISSFSGSCLATRRAFPRTSRGLRTGGAADSAAGWIAGPR